MDNLGSFGRVMKGVGAAADHFVDSGKSGVQTGGGNNSLLDMSEEDWQKFMSRFHPAVTQAPQQAVVIDPAKPKL